MQLAGSLAKYGFGVADAHLISKSIYPQFLAASVL